MDYIVPGKRLSRAPLETSDELTVKCQICECKEIHGYCENCEAYLCEECYDYHRRPKSFREHKLLNKHDMPEVTVNTEKEIKPDDDNTGTEVCEDHMKERLNFYCPVHENFYCGTCIALEHKVCENVEYIPEVAEDFTKSDKKKVVEADLENLSAKVAVLKSGLSQKAEANEIQTAKVLNEIDSFRESLIKELDKHEEKITSQINEINQDNIESVSSMLDTFEGMEKEIDDFKKEMTSLKTNKMYCQLYILTKRTAKTICKLNAYLSNAKQSSDISGCEFHPNVNLKEMLSEENAFGKLSITDLHHNKSDESNIQESNGRDTTKSSSDKKDVVRTTHGKRESTTAKFLARHNDPFRFKKLHSNFDIDMKSFSDDGNKPWVTGITEINDSDRHVICVYNSQRIAVIDSRQKAVNAKLKLNSGPWDVTSIRGGEIIATLPFKNKLIFVKLSSIKGLPSSAIEMKITKQVSVSGDCHSITNDSECLYVSYQNPGKIEILRTDGSLLKTMDSNSLGKPLIDDPQYIAFSATSKLLYISDWKTDTLICMTTDGVVKKTFKEEILKAPTGIAIDKVGRVFVAGYHSNNVVQFSPLFNDVQLSLDAREKIVLPQALAFSANDNKFLVGLRQSNVLKIFRVK